MLPARRLLLACALLAAAVAALGGDAAASDPSPAYDRAHPDKAAPARSNAQLAQAHGKAAYRASRSTASRACFKGSPLLGACTTGDAGSGRWQQQGAAGLRRWHPQSCELRYATPRELRCALSSRRIAMVGDSLIRNLFEGLAHHAGLTVASGVDFGPKSKQRDAYSANCNTNDTCSSLLLFSLNFRLKMQRRCGIAHDK